jgi:aminoglycoside 3-N-acetyltransferase
LDKPDKSVTQQYIVNGLKELGLKAGDVAFVHSSLSSFGYVEGGADTVVKAFLDVLGKEGTLSVPIFRSYFWDGIDQVWDRDNSPSLMGRISETVRTWEGNRRSYHAPHPIAAIGPIADDITERHNLTDFSFDSPFSRLLELNAWIIIMGVDYNRCTMIHLLEERTDIPYRRWIDLTGTVIYNGVPNVKTYPFLARYSGINNDFNPLGKRMEDYGLVKIVTIGNSTVRCFRSKDLYDLGMRSIRQDPLFLISSETKEQARKYIPEYGKILDDKASEPLQPMTTNNPVSQRLANILRIPHNDSPPLINVKNRFETSDELILEEFRLRGTLSEFIPGIIAIPKGHKERLPVVICLHGTGESSEFLMEQSLLERNSSLIGWARELAHRGFVTIAITQFSHPPRHEPWDWELPKLLPAYNQTAMGWLVSDVIACVDYLHTRPEVDTERIAVGGFSLGGISAFYSFVVDTRISAGFTFCGGVGSIRHLIREGNTRFHSVYYYVPDIISGDLDHPQLVSAIASRPLFIYGTTEDAGMPVSGVRAFENEAVKAYESLGAKDKLRIVIEDGQHAMTLKSFDIVSQWLTEILALPT